MILDVARLLLFPALMAFAAASDLFTMTISNRVSLALAAGFLMLAVASGMGPSEIFSNLGAGASVLAVSFVCFAFGWIGGGDAKLAAATALWMGWSLVLDFGTIAAVCGGFLTLGILAARTLPLPPILERRAWIARLHDRKSGVPYGIALAAAGMAQYPHSHIWTAAVA